MTAWSDRATRGRVGDARGQVARFLVIGVLTVLVDFTTYHLLLTAGVDVAWAKGIGFVTGTVFAYFANRRYTFANARPRRGSALRFALLYATTLAINVGVNGLVFRALAPHAAQGIVLGIAFVCATGLSATLNFAGMKWFVFDEEA